MSSLKVIGKETGNSYIAFHFSIVATAINVGITFRVPSKVRVPEVFKYFLNYFYNFY